MRLGAATEIRAPAALVFELLSTPERLPQWNASVAQARRVGDQPIGPGSRAVMMGRLFGQLLESETEVVGFEPPRHFATRAVRGPRIHTRFLLDSAPFGTRLSVDVEGEVPGGQIGGLIAERLLRRDLLLSLERLRQLCEAEARRAASAEPPQGGDPACWAHLRPGHD